MLNQKELFNNAMGRLLHVYQNNPAQLEAVQNAAKVASALMEETITNTPAFAKTPEFNLFLDKRPQAGTGTMSNKPSEKEPPVKISPRQVTTVKRLLIQWVNADPVAFKQFLTKELEPALKEVIEKRYAGAVDDPNKAFEDEVSGKLDERIDDKKSKEAAKEAKKSEHIAKAEEYERQNANQKLANDAEAAARDSKASSLVDNTRGLLSKEEYEDYLKKNAPKKPSLFSRLGNFVKAKGHRLASRLEEAVQTNDTAKLEAIRAEMLEFKSLCEAAGYDVNEAMFG
jgi:hypothetical protein